MNNIRLNQFFRMNEYECPCCHLVMIHELLLEKLFILRCKIMEPIHINSGYRCPKENARAFGSVNSYHMKGMAADIQMPLKFTSSIIDLVKEIGFTGIGYYKDHNFIHLDVRPGKLFEWQE